MIQLTIIQEELDSRLPIDKGSRRITRTYPIEGRQSHRLKEHISTAQSWTYLGSTHQEQVDTSEPEPPMDQEPRPQEALTARSTMLSPKPSWLPPGTVPSLHHYSHDERCMI